MSANMTNKGQLYNSGQYARLGALVIDDKLVSLGDTLEYFVRDEDKGDCFTHVGTVKEIFYDRKDRQKSLIQVEDPDTQRDKIWAISDLGLTVEDPDLTIDLETCFVPEVNPKMPFYATAGASGFDLHNVERVELYPYHPKLIRTGLRFAIPKGFELQIRPRSGMSSKGVAAAFGTIDSDYRGEILVNLTWMPPIGSFTPTAHYHLEPDTRIAQAVLQPVYRANFKVVEELGDTERGSGGFGSTGA